MKSLFVNTEGGKAGTLDGLNLFFGALLGANLGTLDHMALYDYVQLIMILAGTVVTVRMISTSERRGLMLGLIAFYALVLTLMATTPFLRPKGMGTDDVQKLVATLAIWIGFVVITELLPVGKPAAAEASDQA